MTSIARIAALFILAAMALGAVGTAIWLAPVPAGPTTLQATIDDVAHRWPQIDHVRPGDIAARLAEGNTIVFDVRTPAEYAVSHLPGAIHVDPNMSEADFLTRYGDAARGKTAVFYCAVGVRSSRLATRVAPGLQARGAASVVGLAGGIFGWHGEARPLVDSKGPIDFVHPYDATGRKLLARPELARQAPRG